MGKILECKLCASKFTEYEDDYDSIYFTGHCGDCVLNIMGTDGVEND